MNKLLLLMLLPMQAHAVCTVAADCSAYWQMSSGTLKFYATATIDSGAQSRAVIVLHGTDRNADDYFAYGVKAAQTEKALPAALVIAPNFRTSSDNPIAGEYYWSSDGWKQGDRSQDVSRLSSFAVMDQIVGRFCDAGRFPQVRTIVLIGHSAGAQFINRYVGGGAGCGRAEVRYVVMNPSSYLYLDGRRRVSGRWTTPTTCSGYDDYKYGLRALNAYMGVVGASEIRLRLMSRNVVYLAGSLDTKVDSNLDTSCAATLQGANRLARSQTYRDYSVLYGGWPASRWETVPDVGHSGSRMMNSEAARIAAFR